MTFLGTGLKYMGGKNMLDDNCIFCKIIKGEIPSYTVYETEDVKAFMDINPMAKGHLLVIPKNHYTNLFDIDNETLRKIDEAIREIYPKLKEKIGAEGVTRLQNNELGQEVKHYHMHLIPRYTGDSIVETVNQEAKNNLEETFKKLQ